MASGWSVEDIRNKVRKVTGRLSSQELSDSLLNDYINNFYEYTLPAEAKLERIHTYYEFLTAANQQSYDFPTTYINIEPPVTADNFELFYYQDPAVYQRDNYEQVSRQTLGTGNGVQVLFTTTITGFLIQPASVVITDNKEVFQDVNTNYNTDPVVITGSLGGTATVSYSTGAISVTFNTAPSNGQIIYLSYTLFNPGRPQSVLYYNNQLRFYPIPDTAYRIRVKAYQKLSEMTTDATTPLLQQWGPLIAYGAARDIHADLSEMDAYAEITQLYKEQLRYALSRTENNLLNTRAMPMF